MFDPVSVKEKDKTALRSGVARTGIGHRVGPTIPRLLHWHFIKLSPLAGRLKGLFRLVLMSCMVLADAGDLHLFACGRNFSRLFNTTCNLSLATEYSYALM